MIGKDDKRVLAVIPAKGNSNRILNKNMRKCAGHPLIRWTIEAAKASLCVDDIIVTTDDPIISGYCANLSLKVFDRDPEHSEDNVHAIVPVLDVLKRSSMTAFCRKYGVQPFDIVTMLLPTSPLRCGYEIDNSLYLMEETDAPSVVGMFLLGGAGTIRYVDEEWNVHPVIEFEKNQQSADMQQLYRVNGAIFTATIKDLMLEKTFHMEKVIPMPMSPVSSVEVDTVAELEKAEMLLEARIAREE